MKKTLLLAALTMAATPAFASRARLAALQNADHLSDFQHSFERPYEAGAFGELATIEMGASSSFNAGGNAEGGAVRQFGDSNYLGFYVGHQPAAQAATLTTGVSEGAFNRDVANAFAGTVANPLNLFWASKMGDISYGVNLFWENSGLGNLNTSAIGTTTNTLYYSNRKSTLGGLSLGASGGAWEADATVGLTGKTEYNNILAGADNDQTIKSNSNYSVRGAYNFDTMHVYATYGSSSSTYTQTLNSATDTKLSTMGYSVGIIDTRKKDGVDFFYGISYAFNSMKAGLATGDNKDENATLPVILGVEAEANSWLVLRGSVSQNVLYSALKNSPTNGGNVSTNTQPANTTVAAGLGMKFGKFNFDTTLSAANTDQTTAAGGGFGTDHGYFLGQGALTYMF